jgi:hypothetical protein
MDAKHGQRVDERLKEPLESCVYLFLVYLFLWLAGASAVGSEGLSKRCTFPGR